MSSHPPDEPYDDRLQQSLDGLLSALPPLGEVPPSTVLRARRRRATRLAGLGAAAALVVVGGVALALPSPTQERVLPPAVAPSVLDTPSPSGSPSLSGSSTPAPAPTPEPAVTPVPRAPTTTAAPDTSAPPSPAPAAAPELVLEGDGLGVLTGAASIRRLPFGSDGDTARDQVARAQGPGTAAAQPDCGAAVAAVSYDGIVVRVDGPDFAGWTVQTAGLTTADGIGVGTTLAELRQAYPNLVLTRGTIGQEWSAGGLAGGLDGSAETSRVDRIGAGIQCIAR